MPNFIKEELESRLKTASQDLATKITHKENMIKRIDA